MVSPLVTNSPPTAVRTARLASALPTNSTPGCNSFRSLISSTLNCYRSCDQIQRRFLHKLLFCSMRAEPSWTLPAPLSALPEEIPGSQSPALSSFLLRLPVLTLGSRVSSTSADPLYSRSRCFLFVPIRNQRCVSVLMPGGGRSSAGDVFSCRHFSALAGADHKL